MLKATTTMIGLSFFCYGMFTGCATTSSRPRMCTDGSICSQSTSAQTYEDNTGCYGLLRSVNSRSDDFDERGYLFKEIKAEMDFYNIRTRLDEGEDAEHKEIVSFDELFEQLKKMKTIVKLNEILIQSYVDIQQACEDDVEEASHAKQKIYVENINQLKGYGFLGFSILCILANTPNYDKAIKYAEKTSKFDVELPDGYLEKLKEKQRAQSSSEDSEDDENDEDSDSVTEDEFF